jgi:hypothetical protein
LGSRINEISRKTIAKDEFVSSALNAYFKVCVNMIVLNQEIASLTSKQAQEAVTIFYDMLPKDQCQGGKKLSPAGLQASADELKKIASSDIAPFISSVLEGSNEVRREKLSKLLLGEFSRYEQLEPYVRTAIKEASEPHMADITPVIGALLIVLSAISLEVDIHTKNLHIELNVSLDKLKNSFSKIFF